MLKSSHIGQPDASSYFPTHPVLSLRKSTRDLPKIRHTDQLTRLFHHNIDTPPKLKKHWRLVGSNPNVYFIENFFTESEILYLNKAVTIEKTNFIPSVTEDSEHGVFIDSDRTSESFHLTKNQDKVCRDIEERTAGLIGLHQFCTEPLQIVSYTKGQYFGLHHDAGTLDDQNHATLMPSPVRLVTLFGYLNNLPEGQGETEFPFHPQPFKVTPKRGCAIFFSNVHADGSIDGRVAHKANPVADGLYKFGVNAWVCEKSMKGYDANEKTFQVGQVKTFEINKSALFLAEEATRQYLFEHDTIVPAATKKRRVNYSDTDVQRYFKMDLNTSGDFCHVSLFLRFVYATILLFISPPV
jgi:prolyl 4-hydroxylase